MLLRTALYVTLFVSLNFSSALAAIQFIYPTPNSWVKTSGHLIVKLNQVDASAVKITVNGLATEMVDVSSPEYRKLFQDFFIAQALWDLGRNTVQIDMFKGGQKIEAATTEIYLTGNDVKYSAPPQFVPNIMHVSDREIFCVSCHIMNPTQTQMNNSNPKVNPCASCHKKVLNDKYVHGPIGTLSCGYCHSNTGSPKHVVPKKGATLCYECHSDMSQQIKRLTFKHGPVEAGMCEVCHDSHGSLYESQLVKPVNELCYSCHGHIRNKVHVVRTSRGDSHVLQGKPDPSKRASGKEMSCISCHFPHGGNFRYFFVSKSDNRLDLCQVCHNR